MRDERLAAARVYLKEQGYNVPDMIINGLFVAVKGKSETVYESGDFVEVNLGMGEMGHGWVCGEVANGYQIKLWALEEKDQYKSMIATGDVRRLSTEAKALEYDRWRRNPP